MRLQTLHCIFNKFGWGIFQANGRWQMANSIYLLFAFVLFAINLLKPMVGIEPTAYSFITTSVYVLSED